jgi:hypothetical protein
MQPKPAEEVDAGFRVHVWTHVIDCALLLPLLRLLKPPVGGPCPVSANQQAHQSP